MRAFSPGTRFAIRVALVALALACIGALFSPAASAERSFSLRVSLERSRLRRELRKLNQQLEAIEDRYEKLRPTAAVSGRLGAFLAQERLELKSKRGELQEQIRRVKAEFRALRQRVIGNYGDLPGWWSDTPYP